MADLKIQIKILRDDNTILFLNGDALERLSWESVAEEDIVANDERRLARFTYKPVVRGEETDEDIQRSFNVGSAQAMIALRERAARAEAERDTLQAMWNTLADAAKDVLKADRVHDQGLFEKLVHLEHAVYSEHPDTIAPARRELDRLRAVREAAEWIYLLHAHKTGTEDREIISRDLERILKPALDACAKDPAR